MNKRYNLNLKRYEYIPVAFRGVYPACQHTGSYRATITATMALMQIEKNYQCVLLAGGLGTRLSAVIRDRAKPMAIVGGQPFLNYHLQNLLEHGFQETVLCVSHHKDSIMQHYGNDYGDMRLQYSIEQTPLGTGGALLNALQSSSAQRFLLFNADSFCAIPLHDFMRRHQFLQHSLLAVSYHEQPYDYGQVLIDDNKKIARFVEKSHTLHSHWINAGVYAFERRVLQDFTLSQHRSLEYDILPQLLSSGIYAYPSTAEVIDIGTPERLQYADNVFSQQKT